MYDPSALFDCRVTGIRFASCGRFTVSCPPRLTSVVRARCTHTAHTTEVRGLSTVSVRAQASARPRAALAGTATGRSAATCDGRSAAAVHRGCPDNKASRCWTASTTSPWPRPTVRYRRPRSAWQRGARSCRGGHGRRSNARLCHTTPRSGPSWSVAVRPGG